MDVLLVEDDCLVRECLVQALSQAGMDTGDESTAEDALRTLAGPRKPDVLITDINLGRGLDGLAFARAARELAPNIKIVFISGRYATLRGLDSQERFLAKPFATAALIETVTQLREEPAMLRMAAV